jgi:PPM family protein phosphatase
MTWSVEAGVRTLRGRNKSTNDDAAAIAGLLLTSDSSGAVTVRPPRGYPMVAMIADGVGGQVGGRIASHSCAGQLAQDSRLFDGEEEIALALNDAHAALYEAMRRDPSLRGMGTTIAGICIPGVGKASVFNVGDSRLLVRDKEVGLVQLTVDDAERRGSGTSSILSQCLGGTVEPVRISPHISAVELWGGDRFLLCSDGLSDVLTAQAISDVLAGDESASFVAGSLADLALAEGASDDVTVIVLDVTGMES